MDIKSIIQQMTLEEKATMCTGKGFWNIPGVERLGIDSMLVTDGPHGVRLQLGDTDHLGINESVKATCFAPACGLATSWNPDVAYEIGSAIGREAKQHNINVMLGPGVNIKRSPLCGRNFEYYSEDPYLTGKVAAGSIRGIQSVGVGTSVKHYACNNQENERLTTDSVMSERALREIYLKAFEIIVKEANPTTLMSSYNLINGVYAAENKHTLKEILCDEWRFDGFVMSDWGGTNDIVKSVANGQSVAMPTMGKLGVDTVINAVKSGELSEQLLDESVEKILKVAKWLKDNETEVSEVSLDKHHEVARETAKECIVLLKNDNNVLPLNKTQKIAVVGEFAEKPRYQGGGSSHINPYKVDVTLDLIKSYSDNVVYSKGYEVEETKPNETLIKEAVEASKNCDVCVVFVGLPETYESEGYDRTNLCMPQSHYILLEEISKVQKNVAVVLSNGAVVDVAVWNDKVSSILECNLLGQGGGYAIAATIFGDNNPSGKLAETIPYKLEDTSCYTEYPGVRNVANYHDDIFVGYRHYASRGIDVLYPFGHGLSYSTFEYSDLKVSNKVVKENKVITISVKVTNTSKFDGKEVVQLYVSDITPKIVRAKIELINFKKVFVKAGETVEVSMDVKFDDFRYYDMQLNRWFVEASRFQLFVGSSSTDLRLSEVVDVDGDNYYNYMVVTRNTTLGDAMRSAKGEAMLSELFNQIFNGFMGSGVFSPSEEMKRTVKGMPLRSISMMAGEAFAGDKLDEMIAELNRK